MRPLRLDVEGFGTFRDPVSLDFSDADYFALVGPTGSGKTTIIDAICFALYGSAPRWPRRNQVSLAMAPSVGHTRVSLIFEVGAARYAVVRALAKSARGQVSTKQSRLITLPGGLDLDGDLGGVLDEELDSIAESPAEVEVAVEKILGLSYEHFIQSVVLPQGGFAKFLHAEKRERQDLLVSLLGLGVYERVKQRANSLAEESRTRAATLSGELIKYADATEAAEDAVATQLRTLEQFQDGLPVLLAPWKSAAADLEAAKERTAGHEADLQTLSAVQPPAGLNSLATERTEATSACGRAADAVAAAEKAELDAEQEAQDAGRPSDWQELITLYDQLEDTKRQLAAAIAVVAGCTETVEQVSAEWERANKNLEDARTVLDEVQIAHAADHLASILAAGSECPVCRQVVETVPDRPPHQGIDEARKRLTKAEQELKLAESARSTAQRDHDRAVDEHDRLSKMLADLEARTKGRPGADEAGRAYEMAQRAETALINYRHAARTARMAQRKADEAAKALDERWTDAGRQLNHARDSVAHLTPPTTTGDHAEDWAKLVGWAAAKITELRAEVTEAVARREAAATRELEQRSIVIDALKDHAIAVTRSLSETSVATAVATAVASAQHRVDRIKERRAEAARLERDIIDQQESEQLHRELGNLLSARNFERWMVEEALQAMMIEASTTLSELSGGQFELALDSKQDIQVIDHNDASSQRPVQTLSGGETFQASLALALALSSQIAALSPSTGQLDTILLDEGFGTLDPSTLDVVASTLEQLAGGGERTVGLVTHVATLAERVPVRFEVRREGSRSSVQKVWA